MTSTLSGETLGAIVTPIGHDGTNFRPLLLDSSGRVIVAGPASGQFPARLYVWNGTEWAVVAAHSTGQLYARVTSMPTVTVGSLENITEGQVKSYIYDGSAWQKQLGDADGNAFIDIREIRGHADGLPNHVKGVWRAEYEFTVTAGQAYVNSDTVSAGEIWVAHCAVFWNANHGGTRWILGSRGNSINPYIDRIDSPTAGVYRITTAPIYLEASGLLRFTSEGATVGDVIHLNVHGYKFYAS